jgi:hypothetical protein
MRDKDTAASRVDMQERNIRPQLWLRGVHGNADRLWMPDAPYVLPVADKVEFLNTLSSIKFPSKYVSNLRSRITNGTLRGLKSHDYHILLQHVLPVCLRNIGDAQVVGCIVRLSRVFQ